MMVLGAFVFISMGLSIANSIEARQSKLAANIMTGIFLLGILAFIVGFLGYIITHL